MKKIHYALEGEVAKITMDDGKANAMDFGFFEEMNKAMDRSEKDRAKVLTITGRPDFFSGGLDLHLIPTLSPTELNTFAETFSRMMLRVFSLPVPTIAVCTGHAVAGGTILAFSCDLRFILDGPYLIQMNEMLIGLPLPSWLLLICGSAIPRQWQMEVLLHARGYSPKEAVERGLFHGVYRNKEEMIAEARVRAENLKTLNVGAYDTSKKRMRGPDIDRVLRLLKDELPAPLVA